MTEIYIDIHHDNHLNRPRSRKALKTFGALGRFLALATFSSICMIIISVSMPRSPRHNDNNNIMTETIVFQEQEKIDPCSFYGCPIYPLEFNRNNFSQQQEESTHSSYAMITRIGESHRINQDRAALFTPFLTKLSPSTVDSFLVALFDGHGRQGHIIAEYCIEEFPYRLAKKLNELSDPVNDKDILRAMNETFLETDIYAPPNALEGGATATISLRIGSKLYIGNVGDSQTILVSADSAVAYMTRKDKAILPEERSRIEGLGGKIFINPQNISRVVVYSVTARESIALAMSRSIGDWEWKPVGVTAEPGSLDVIDLSTHPDSFLISASDGLWDRRRQEFFANQFSESFVHKKTSPAKNLFDVMVKIIPKVKIGYLDDITAIVIKI